VAGGALAGDDDAGEFADDLFAAGVDGDLVSECVKVGVALEYLLDAAGTPEDHATLKARPLLAEDPKRAVDQIRGALGWLIGHAHLFSRG
jgi:hypothetical protein